MIAGFPGHRTLIGIAVMLTVLPAGCAPTTRHGQGQITLSRKHYDEGNYILAAHQLTAFIQNEPFSRELDQAHYLRGLCYWQMGSAKHAAAKSDFKTALKKTRTAEIRGLCRVAMGHIAFEQRDESPDQAAAYYQAALADLTNAPPRDIALYRLGLCLQRMGQWDPADSNLSECFNRFPDSEFAPLARRIFGARVFRFQAGAFSDIDQARRKIEQLAQRGWPADWAARQDDGHPIYLVYTGRYDSYRDARKALAALSEFEPDATIVATPLSDVSQKQGNNNHENKP